MSVLKSAGRTDGRWSLSLQLRLWIYGGSDPRLLLGGSRMAMENLARSLDERKQRRAKKKKITRGNEKDPVVAVLVLDSLDLGINSKPHGVYPRIALFDYDSMKKMVDAISVNMGGG
ncbi:hypothetical protein ZWY2020_050834 [Hordeum vulgare]|nr:hypothetical protein ZWY2020_050834 [Hordeum vulgare]